MQISRWNLRSNGSIHPPRFNYELCNSVYVRQRRHENCDSTSIRVYNTRGGFDEVEETLSSANLYGDPDGIEVIG